MRIVAKIRRTWTKLRLQPIHVFCLHHVCAEFDAESMEAGDWMQMDEFKEKISAMRQSEIEFISLAEACKHISGDLFRSKKFAVLTFDDGYASLKEILPWLNEQNIPATLFLNGKYLDGKSYRTNSKERYLTKEDLDTLHKLSSYLTIASHGWEHTSALEMSADEFTRSVRQNVERLHTYPCYIPFHAYTWGKHTKDTDAYLQSQGIMPVYIDGQMNYNNHGIIHREIMN